MFSLGDVLGTRHGFPPHGFMRVRERFPRGDERVEDGVSRLVGLERLALLVGLGRLALSSTEGSFGVVGDGEENLRGEDEDVVRVARVFEEGASGVRVGGFRRGAGAESSLVLGPRGGGARLAAVHLAVAPAGAGHGGGHGKAVGVGETLGALEEAREEAAVDRVGGGVVGEETSRDLALDAADVAEALAAHQRVRAVALLLHGRQRGSTSTRSPSAKSRAATRPLPCVTRRTDTAEPKAAGASARA